MAEARSCGDGRYGPRMRKGFTLLELLVVIVIIALLMAIVLPSLRKVRQYGRVVVCAANLRSVGTAIHAYAHDYHDTIPFGPDGLPMAGGQFYTATGNVTSLISLYNGAPVGLGLLLENYLAEQPKVLFCPGSDQPSDSEDQLSRVGKRQAEGGYYYRHASVAMISGTPEEFHTKLGALGKNRNDHSISALVMDVQFLADPSLRVWGIFTRTSHQQRTVNALLADGQVLRLDNTENLYTVDVGSAPHDGLDKILGVFERADELY